MSQSLGDRMKVYEQASKGYLTRRTPVIIRIDGCHFHTFTRKFQKPFDPLFMAAMRDTTLMLCTEIQGCVLGYTQSDEITLVLCDYRKLDTAAWFDNQIQKICSVSASMAALYFQKSFAARYRAKTDLSTSVPTPGYLDELAERYKYALARGGYFDSRCFNLPKEEVCNCLIWRQQDAERNSILSLAQSLYSHKELQGISCKALQDKMFTEKGVNWNDLKTYERRGSCAIRTEGEWMTDFDIPVFSRDREYIERFVYCEEE